MPHLNRNRKQISEDLSVIENTEFDLIEDPIDQNLEMINLEAYIAVRDD